ncbi:hypothetical protein F3Y22_tig00111213pilonHSYRG00626 [Hibiscus syriacus]|uniref:F-box associated domain-containing protein n=1 Tax=Hibiscus syriacus TaxID=106335 RepID=A0A6A2YV17_HIBSY|nr:hypothetical protein F3Y22_tig00111213pilonHSYRG00626 [Hibiscus syriacus]
MRFFVDRDLVDYRDMHGQLPPHFVNMFVFTFCVGGGLICLLDWTNSRITLSNPAAREFKILPECNEDIPDKSYTFAHTLGFGLDPLSNDYKVVHIRSLLPLNDRVSFWDTEMMETSARTNEVWILNDGCHWTKILKIVSRPEFERMFGFWKYGEVLAESEAGEFVLFDLDTRNSRELGIKTRVRGDLLQVYTYEENLASIK